MSRRSSKTAHVLGLITSGKSDDAPENISPNHTGNVVTERSESPVDNRNPNILDSSETISSTLPISEEPTAPETNQPVSFTEDSGIPETSVAPKNRNFRHILSNPDKAQAQAKAPIVEILFNDHDPLSDLIRDQLEAGEVMAEATRKENIAMSEESKKIVEDRSEENQGVVMTKDSSSNKVSLRDKNTDESIELDYKFLNVSEELVREKVLDVMNNVDACTCDRCIVDTVALAITNLPAKCIVADKDAIFPLLSYYRSKFSTLVHTELMKAALIIKDNPHH